MKNRTERLRKWINILSKRRRGELLINCVDKLIDSDLLIFPDNEEVPIWKDNNERIDNSEQKIILIEEDCTFPTEEECSDKLVSLIKECILDPMKSDEDYFEDDDNVADDITRAYAKWYGERIIRECARIADGNKENILNLINKL